MTEVDAISVFGLVAAVGSAVAAVYSLRIARESLGVSRRVAIHQTNSEIESRFAIELRGIRQGRRRLPGVLEELSTGASVSVDRLIREYETADHRHRGGRMPRPLRHVLYDGGFLIGWHIASRMGARKSIGIEADLDEFRNRFSIFESLRWKQRLRFRAAEDCGGGPECVFGLPDASLPIASSLAIHWAAFDCMRRTDREDTERIVGGICSHEIPEFSNFVKKLEIASTTVSGIVSQIEALAREIETISGDEWRDSRVLLDLRFMEVAQWSAALSMCSKYLAHSRTSRLEDATTHVLSIVACHHLVLEACSRLLTCSTSSAAGGCSHLQLALS